MAPSSSKFCPQVAHKRFATLELHLLRLNFTVRVAHKKGLLRLVIRGLLQCFRIYDQISKSPSCPKVQTQGPEDQDEGPNDQRTKGPEDQGQGTKGREPEDQNQKE